MPSLCRRLPDLPADGTAERHVFANARRSAWCHDDDLADFHAEFSAEGLPYTLQTRPAAEDHADGDDGSWEDACLSAAERNPSLCRQ